MGGKEGKEKIQLSWETHLASPSPKLRWESNCPSPPPTESLDRKKAQASESRRESGGGAGGVGNGDQGLGGGKTTPDRLALRLRAGWGRGYGLGVVTPGLSFSSLRNRFLFWAQRSARPPDLHTLPDSGAGEGISL